MEIFNKVIEGTTGVYSVRISLDDLKAIEDEKILKLTKEVRLHGFRPGKVPANIIRNMYGVMIASQAKEESIEKAVRFIVKEEKIEKVLNYSSVVKKDDENGIEAEFKIIMSPKFELKPLSDLNLEKFVYKVTDEDVKKIIDEAREKATKWIEDPKHTVAKEGDKVVAHFELKNKLKGVKEHLENQDIEIVLGDDGLIDDIWKHFVDAKVNDVCEFSIHYPDGLGDKKLSGKDIEYKATVKNIFVASKYELNEEFITSVGYKDLDEAMKLLKEREQDKYNRMTTSVLDRDILDKISSAYDFEIPESLVDAEVKAVKDTIAMELRRLKKKNSPEVDAGCLKLARERVKIGFVISKISELNSLKVTRNEVEKYVRGIAMLNPGNEKAIYDSYSKPEQAVTLVGALLEAKVLNWISSECEKNSQIKETEVSIEKLKELDEEVFDFIKNAEDADYEVEEKEPKKVEKKTTKKVAKASEEKSSEEKPKKTAKAKTTKSEKTTEEKSEKKKTIAKKKTEK